MTEADRAHFLATARLPPGSYAHADKRTLTADAAWIEIGRHAGVDAAWLRGAPRDPLVVPVTWSPDELAFGTAEELQRDYEYVGTEGNVEVYRHKRTGQKVYTGRTRPALSPEDVARLDALRDEANKLLKPLLFKRQHGFFERRRLNKGIALLEQVTATVPDHGVSRWSLGLALRALGDQARALDELRLAYALCPALPDVGREYAGQCFIVGLAEDGLEVSRALTARFPEDVGLQSNLALALLLGGDLAEAQAVAEAAQRREPDDAITRNLVHFIRDVRAGTRARPTRLPGF
jgi:tetratricopeptide (TPR) repeat protein